MKKKSILLCSLLSASTAFSQQVISSSGDDYSSANGTLSYTIGEVVINTATNGIDVLTQGFHQSEWNFVGLEDLSPDYEVTVFPNPSSEVLTIQTSKFEGVRYNLYDALGKIVLRDVLSAEQTNLEVSDLPTGSYALTLYSKDQNIKTFKLIKN